MTQSNFADKTIWTGDNLDILRGMNSDRRVRNGKPTNDLVFSAYAGGNGGRFPSHPKSLRRAEKCDCGRYVREGRLLEKY